MKPLCSEPGCDRETLCRGLCKRHYQRARWRGELQPLPPPVRRPCRVDSCARLAMGGPEGHGLCKKCYQREVVNRRVSAAKAAERGDLGPSAPPRGPKTTRPRERTERNRFVADNLGLVGWTAKRLDLGDEDARQALAEGLIYAADRFDPSKGFRFSSFAAATLHGYALRWLQLSPEVREPVHRQNARRTLSRDLARGLTLADAASASELTLCQAQDLLDRPTPPRPASLDAPLSGDTDTTRHEMIGTAANQDDRLQTAQLSDRVNAVLTALPVIEARALALRFGFPCPPQSTDHTPAEPIGTYRGRPQYATNDLVNEALLSCPPEAFGEPHSDKAICRRTNLTQGGHNRTRLTTLGAEAIRAFYAEAEELYEAPEAAGLLAALLARAPEYTPEWALAVMRKHPEEVHAALAA